MNLLAGTGDIWVNLTLSYSSGETFSKMSDVMHQSMMGPCRIHTATEDDAEREGACFQHRLTATILKDFQSGVRLVRDHFPRYLERLPGELLFRIGVAFYQEGDFEKARRCLGLAAGKDGSWQHKAMALSISGAMTANFLFLGIILYRKLQGFSLSYLLNGLGKVLAAALMMGLSLSALEFFLRGWMQGGLMRELLGLFFLVFSGAVIYGYTLYLLKLQELRILLSRFFGKRAV